MYTYMYRPLDFCSGRRDDMPVIGLVTSLFYQEQYFYCIGYCQLNLYPAYSSQGPQVFIISWHDSGTRTVDHTPRLIE